MKGNVLVLLLPALVMLGLFLFGYMTINQSESFTNEDLQRAIDISVEEVDENTTHIEWQWADLPEDGMLGDDYLEVTAPQSDESVESLLENVEVILWQGEESVFESQEYFSSEDGIVIPFPNGLENEQVLGPLGQVTLRFQSGESITEYLEVEYYHTWVEHSINKESGVSMEDRFAEEEVQSYWSIMHSN